MTMADELEAVARALSLIDGVDPDSVLDTLCATVGDWDSAFDD
jgi:hypothetical protein